MDLSIETLRHGRVAAGQAAVTQAEFCAAMHPAQGQQMGIPPMQSHIERNQLRRMIEALEHDLDHEIKARGQAEEGVKILAEQLRATVAAGQAVVEQNGGLLRDVMLLAQDLDRARQEAHELLVELQGLKAKYEPVPPPAPNPWGKRYVGGLGAAFGL